MLELRIHHFFDILRDYGNNKELKPHHYGHSYHIIGKKIYKNMVKEFKIVNGSDFICKNCNKLIGDKCIDLIDHRIDFKNKEDFNNYLDERILKVMSLSNNQIVRIEEILEKSNLYVDNIFDIYLGNSKEHTELRKINVRSGIEKKKRELRSEA